MIKQVIVVRKDLHMRMGKVAVQCAHASMKIFFNRMYRNTYENEYILNPTPEMIEWIEGLFTKICVRVDSLDELMEIYEEATANQIPASIIEDCGLTEFNNVKTITCCAIGPDHEEKINKITGHLQLL